jgi:acyl carrier protein
LAFEIPDDDVAEWETVADIAATVARLTEERVCA